MLPLKLKMCGFCSFLEETEIDFTGFGTKGLYLIAGDTGAGKTTLFDAITYALYGQASGDMRKPKLFRSQNAPPEVPTYVELTFLSGGKKYKIRRSPEYMRPAKRGGGLTKQTAEAVLTTYDGDAPQEYVLTGLQRAGTKRTGSEIDIESIIGIDAKKFKQLSMIAQGSFMKVLNADTETKNIILRSIFNTENYRRIELALKERAEKYEREYTALSGELTSRLALISCGEDSGFKEELAAVKERNSRYVTGADDCTDILTRIIAEDERQAEALRESLTETDGIISKRNELIGTLTEREKRRIQYLELCAGLEQSQRLLPRLEEQYTSVCDNEAKAALLDSEYTRLESSMEDHKKRELLIGQLGAVERAIAAASDKITKKSSRSGVLAEDIERFKAEYDSLKDCAAEQERIKAEIVSKQKTITEYRRLLTLIVELEKSDGDYRKKRSVYIQCSTRSEKLRSEYDLLNKAFLDDQAGILASTLTEGKPCPVCGSLTHPCKASMPEQAPTELDVKSAREKADKASQEASSASAECAAANARSVQLTDSIKSSGKELFGDFRSVEELKAEVTEAGVRLKKEIEQHDTELVRINSMTKRRDELHTNIPVMEKELEAIRSELELLNREIAGSAQKKEGIASQIREIDGKLAFPTMKETADRMNRLLNESRSLRAGLKQAERELNDCRTRISQQSSMLEGFADVSKESSEEELKKLKKELSKLREVNDKRSDELSRIRARLSYNTGVRDFFGSSAGKLEKLMRLASESADLRDTANAKLREGRSRLTLETYAQAGCFDRVLFFANERLVKMSSGKYEFRRSEVPMDNASKTGLDINVFDYESGTERSVVTLSGGESFMASLSLALGFSDVIQSESGGIRLDTMFIDEGFGTLDEHVLENAYSVFSDLSNDSRCLVGIISHVEELKSRIQNRITVTKDIEGNSHASTEPANPGAL